MSGNKTAFRFDVKKRLCLPSNCSFADFLFVCLFVGGETQSREILAGSHYSGPFVVQVSPSAAKQVSLQLHCGQRACQIQFKHEVKSSKENT